MKAFADLYAALDETTKTNEKIAAMSRYFSIAPPKDAAWAIHFLIGRRPKRLIETRKLVEWAIQEAGVPDWLYRIYDIYYVKQRSEQYRNNLSSRQGPLIQDH